MSNLIHTEVRDGFTIKFFAENDYCSISDLFDGKDVTDTVNKIEAGDLVHFCAKVTASKNGIELARGYLGGCVYKDEQEFVDDNFYYGDMVKTAIAEAKQAIKDLCDGSE